ncbi:HAD family phosphatase [Streptomyces sp. MZ04]|nr:HAD family phosphatase [Streptomyces sp. MZ04]
MDGTLVDTEEAWVETVEKVVARYGHALVGEGRRAVFGRAVEDTAELLYETVGAPREKLAAELGAGFAARVADGAEPRPGALQLLGELRESGIPTALVSASPRVVVDGVAASLGHPFDALYGAEDTARTKPAPDPYLAAAAALGADPARCVAVEDTVTGVTSARAAGCVVLAVPSVEAISPAGGVTVLDTLEAADVALLRALLGD